MENVTQKTEVFADMPDAMVEEILRCTESLAEKVQHQVNQLRSQRDGLQDEAEKAGVIEKAFRLTRAVKRCYPS